MFSVIFDMDGTLLDTQSIFGPAWDYAGSFQGFNNMGSHLKYVCGMNENGWKKYVLDNFHGIDLDEFDKTVKKYVLENLIVKFKPGAEEIVRFLKENNIKIAIASGSSRELINKNLETLNFDVEFDAIVGGLDVKNGKPAPDIFLKTAELMGVEPQTCIVFEDSLGGIQAAHAAGMKCIGVPDVAEFDEETQKLLYKQFSSLNEALPFLRSIIK